MKANEQTNQQIDRALRKIAQKFPMTEDISNLTDIHLRVTQESGEMVAFDDEENEITRVVIEPWIDNKDPQFYDEITPVLRKSLERNHEMIDGMGILKPFSFVLENDEKEILAELYLADDDTVIISGELMEGLDQDLDNFLEKLMEDEE